MDMIVQGDVCPMFDWGVGLPLEIHGQVNMAKQNVKQKGTQWKVNFTGQAVGIIQYMLVCARTKHLTA